MAIFFVFWDSVMASICFVLSTILKGLEAFIEAFVSALAEVITILICCGGGALLISLFMYSGKLIKSGEFFSAVLDIVGIILIIGLIIAIVGGLASPILAIIVAILGAIATVIFGIVSFLYDTFEKGYLFFLKRITVRLKMGHRETFEIENSEE